MSDVHASISRSKLEESRNKWIEVAKENSWYEPGPFGIITWVYPDGTVYDSLYQSPEHRGHDTIVVFEDIGDDEATMLAVIELHDDKIVLHAQRTLP